MCYQDSIEIDELRHPIFVHARRLMPDTEGAGRFRGALGAYSEFSPLDCEMVVAYVSGYVHQALAFQGQGAVNLIGLGMWLALIMAFNVWFIIWPAQKKILNIVPGATDEEKAKLRPRALIASRLNTLLSLPMLYCMVSANLG